MEILNLITSLFVLLLVSKFVLVALITALAVVVIMKVGNKEKGKKSSKLEKREPVFLGVISESSYRLGWKYVNTTRFIFLLLSLNNITLPILYLFAWFITSDSKKQEEVEVEEFELPKEQFEYVENEDWYEGIEELEEEFELPKEHFERGFELPKEEEFELPKETEQEDEIEPFSVDIEKEWE